MLTMLGIIIGVGAVITMLAAGAGAQKRIDDQIAALGSNILTVNAAQFFAGGISRDRQTLVVDDVAALIADNRYLDAVVPGDAEPRSAEVRQHEYEHTAGRHDGRLCRGLQLQDLAWPLLHARRGRAHAAASSCSATTFRIGSKWQRTSWSAARCPSTANRSRSSASSTASAAASATRVPTLRAVIPFRTAEQRVFGRKQMDNISVRVAEDASMERAMVDIERVLRRRHKLTPGSANDFSIVDRREFLDTQQEAQQTFTMLLASIAGVSLLVGGIGIMNIMLVSVTERTREIGIRMALGATRFSILLQFLVESVTLCLLGGGLGILLGTVAARTLSRFAGWEVFVSPESVGLASAFSVR